jgi:hypothetical protein
MELKPEESLERLMQSVKDLRSPHKDRNETLKQLQGTVHRCEVELANLGRTMGKNPERVRLFRELTFHVEMAKMELRQQ